MCTPPTTPHPNIWNGWKRVRLKVNVKKIFFDNLINVLKFTPFNKRKVREYIIHRSDSIIKFGKHKGKTYQHIRDNEKGYAKWVISQQSPSGVLGTLQKYLKNPNEKRIEIDDDEDYEDYKYKNIDNVFRTLCKKKVVIDDSIEEHRKLSDSYLQAMNNIFEFIKGEYALNSKDSRDSLSLPSPSNHCGANISSLIRYRQQQLIYNPPIKYELEFIKEFITSYTIKEWAVFDWNRYTHDKGQKLEDIYIKRIEKFKLASLKSINEYLKTQK
jgi:hypothetical protein